MRGGGMFAWCKGGVRGFGRRIFYLSVVGGGSRRRESLLGGRGRRWGRGGRWMLGGICLGI